MLGFRKQHRVALTKTGIVFVLIILLLQLAAFNTGENLFYLVVSSVISFLAIGWWASRKGIRHLSLKRIAPEAVHRGESFSSTMRLTNRHRFWPVIGVSLSSCNWDESLWLDSIPSRATAEFRAYDVMPKRGRHPLPPIQLHTSFPFGLIERHSEMEDGETILVYPRVYSLSKRITDELDDSGQTPKMSVSAGDEFFLLRDYVPGDDIRHVSWKVSARMGRLIVRELEPSISRMVVLVMDTRGLPKTPDDEENLELAMDLAASLAVALLGLHYIVGLELPNCSIGLGRGGGQATKILEALAVANVVDASEYGDDWYRSNGNHTEASKVFLATDPARWGVANAQGRSRVLDPRESLHG